MPFEGWDDQAAARGARAPALAAPRTYRMGRGIALFLALAMLGFTAAAVASTLVDGPVGLRIGLPALFLGFAALCAAGLVQSRRFRVTIDDRGIAVVAWRTPRRLDLDRIRGLRRIEAKGTVTLVLEPKDAGTKPLRFQRVASMDAAFDAWLAQLPDLDAAERERAEAELLASSALGATPAERKAKLTRARSVASALNAASIGVAVWAFLYPRPYALAMTAAFGLPLLALALALFARDLFQLVGSQKDARPSLALPLFMPGLAGAVHALEYDLLTPAALLVPGLGAGAVLTAIALLADRRLRETPALLLFVFPLMLALSAAGATIANCADDPSPASTFEAAALGKHVTRGKSTSWYLDLGPWGPRAEPDSVRVPRWTYEAVEVGAMVQVQLRPGRLGLPWFRVVP